MSDALRCHAPPALQLPDELLEHVRTVHEGEGRLYHNLRHVLEVLGWFDEVARHVGWRQPREVYLAALFHDAVYVPGSKTNEADSVRLAERAIRKHALDVDGGRVRALILLTAEHGKLSPADVDHDAAHFLDCDMAILGSSPERFAEYDDAIAREYAPVVTRPLYALGRRRFLARLLKADRIFLSDYFHRRLGTAARRNLSRALR